MNRNLVDFSNDETPVETPNTVRASPQLHRGITVDTRYESKQHLLTHVEGSPWQVNYYSQVLNRDSAPTGLLINRHPIYQQYRYIERFEMRVSSALTTSQDSESKELTLTGSAIIYPSLIPNEGDVFIADIGDGQEGIFKITNSERRSIFRDTCYAVEYQLIDYLKPEYLGLLASKVIQKYMFRRDFLEYGQSPLIVDSEAAIISKIEVHYKSILEVYFKSFFSKEYSTLIIPGQEYPIYDPFLTKAVLTFFTTWDSPEVRYVRLMNVDDDNNMSAVSFWDMLIKGDRTLLNYVFTEYGIVSSKLFTKNPMLEGIYFSGIPFIMYPKDRVLDTDYTQKDYSKPFAPFMLRNVPPRTNLPNIDPIYDDGSSIEGFDLDIRAHYIAKRDGLPLPEIPAPVIQNWDWSQGGSDEVSMIQSLPDIRLVTFDEHYVFSSTFYRHLHPNQNPNYSKIEVLVCQMLAKKTVSMEILLHLCETYHRWGALERFYYLPIILMLIKYCVRSV